MRLERIDEAINEAERFLKRAKAARVQAEVACKQHPTDKYLWISSGALAAACKRSSMDLSKALVPLRKAER